LKFLSEVTNALTHLIFPHLCEGCSSPHLAEKEYLCSYCYSELPETIFFDSENNPVEKLFIGRLMVEMAGAQFYYTRNSIMRKLMHEFKYKGNVSLGSYLGNLMAHSICNSKRFNDIDLVIPVPLYNKKQRKRGYNQAEVLAASISIKLKKPLLTSVVVKQFESESQTKKNRIERWNNAEGSYVVLDINLINNKHILLVDDVVTTGATIEACGRAIKRYANCKLSIATLCYTSGN
jgi:Predicted amidophosphoribosyltransferases